MMDKLDVAVYRANMTRNIGLHREDQLKILAELERLQDAEAARAQLIEIPAERLLQFRKAATCAMTWLGHIQVQQLLDEVERLSGELADMDATRINLKRDVEREQKNRADDRARYLRDFAKMREALQQFERQYDEAVAALATEQDIARRACADVDRIAKQRDEAEAAARNTVIRISSDGSISIEKTIV